ncbi:MAG: type II toxin-antitoxin system RelE/ParE family toxin [Pseudomonadota bacterium]|nr:type II toxin-antitoxin system RelE/ParE family toxin [Pseudomonadota bacterium]
MPQSSEGFQKTSAKKEGEAIPTKKAIQRIVRRIASLSEEPQPPGCQKLSGNDRYRTRQAQYPIVYEIRDDETVIIVIKVHHRQRPPGNWHDSERSFE